MDVAPLDLCSKVLAELIAVCAEVLGVLKFDDTAAVGVLGASVPFDPSVCSYVLTPVTTVGG
jgi:hypothetical protein